MMNKIIINDNISALKDLVTFIPNKYQPIHRWFLLVEGFSSEFVRRLIGEQNKKPSVCFDPFGGVGTTALTCQNLGIKCYSIENNPFFCQVAKAKLETGYDPIIFSKLIDAFESYLSSKSGNVNFPDLETQTLFESKDKERWIFNKPVGKGLIDIAERIQEIELEYPSYGGLFRIALGSILIQVSNVFRNGKCLSYKHNWEDNKISRQDVHRLLVDVCKNVLLVDIRAKETRQPRIMNSDLFMVGDVRNKIEEIPDNEIDIIITSPPYLNSRDYTDTYRLELWILGYVSTFKEERSIRESALTSHVQVDLKNFSCPDIKGLKSYINHLESLNGQLWNKDIPNMIKGYFHDIENILVKMRKKLKKKGKVYINVSNSAYYGKICEVDTFIAEIARKNGYNPLEIKIARYLKSSSQQKLSERIRESVLVLQRD